VPEPEAAEGLLLVDLRFPGGHAGILAVMSPAAWRLSDTRTSAAASLAG
jgi:hypothetical protein